MERQLFAKLSWLLLWLLLCCSLALGEEQQHQHRHQHAASTSAPATHARRNQQQRLLQLQQAQQTGEGSFELEAAQQQRRHHLRHEQHMRAELAASNRQPPVSSKLQLEQLPASGQQQHHLRHHNRHHAAWQQRVFPTLQQQQTTAAATTTTTTDAPLRQALSNYSSRYFDRDGIYPAWTQAHSTRSPNWQQQLIDSDEDADDDDTDEDEDENYEDDIDVAAAAELAKQMPRYSLFSQQLPSISSTEQDYEADEQVSSSNKHPSIANAEPKAAAKRNIFDWIFKRDKHKQQTTTEKPEPLHSESYSNEQWNKLEHESHLQQQQQQHQKQLEALRASSNNKHTPLIRGAGPMSRSAIAIDNEHSDNSYTHKRIGALTRHKEKELGAQDAVYRHRNWYEDADKAKSHLSWVQREGQCRVPQRRCVSVENDPAKIYYPHCTILYRCSADSGCCFDRTQICAPKSVTKVQQVIHVKASHERRSSYETLSFDNHTECHCIDRISLAKDVSATKMLQNVIALNCKCPRLFEKILQDDGQCRCDCTSGNDSCERLKRGGEHFAINDRKCIQQGLCKAPACQFGVYMERHGRCPIEYEPQHNARYTNTNSIS
ncbi:Pvf3 [Drosophila busckii]|uniref:Pvf3 n=1 Tax=Drosophila busckii TaxID=30019 RepID=A0A0M5J1A3_DROBS|nr:putative mediator of RNA polymerase II transcription subunit 12 [Drosophila busckii]ALC38594.1 Pvf3 [Drosophila busckii]